MNFGRAIGMRPRTLSLRSDKGTSLGFAVGRGCPLFALTPSPSPTLWERGVGARGSAPCSAFPLSRLRERGTKGVRAIQRACPFTLAQGKTAPTAEIPRQAVVPLSAPAGSPCEQGEPSRRASRGSPREAGGNLSRFSVPLAKRGEP